MTRKVSTRGRVVYLSLAFCATWMIVGTHANAQPFTFIQPGFKAEFYAFDSEQMGSIAFAPDADPWVSTCFDSGFLKRYDKQGNVQINGYTVHPRIANVDTNTGCGMTTYFNGKLYSNTPSGVTRQDAETGLADGGPFGANGDNFGIAAHPSPVLALGANDNDIAYAGSDGKVHTVNAALTTQGVITPAVVGFMTGLAFEPSGKYLFAAMFGQSSVKVIRYSDGAVVQTIPVAPFPSDVTYYSNGAQSFLVVTHNTNGGILERVDFPNGNFEVPPGPPAVVTTFASGATGNGFDVESNEDGIYLTRNGVNVGDQLLGATQNNALIRIFPDSAPVNTVQLGSAIVWPEVRISWDNAGLGAGDRWVDTIVSLVNNSPSAVTVKLYLVNGDCQSLAPGIPPPGYVPPGFAPPATFEPGCVALDCQFDLTPNEPLYWSVMLGAKINPRPGVSVHQGDICPRFDNLDADGRADTELDPTGVIGLRRLRGYLVAIAVDSNTGLEKSYDFLSGAATIVDYNHHNAYQYKAYAFKGLSVVPDGVLHFDGAEYSSNWDKLLMHFFASSSSAYGADATPQGAADGPNSLNGRLSLLPMKIDLTNNVGEFVNNTPFVTRATLTAYNENETIRTVIQRCICCWDSGLFSNYSAINNFLTATGLGTDHGKATIDAKANANCGRVGDPNASPPDPGLTTADAPLLGIVSQQSTWTVAGTAFTSTDGAELSGIGVDNTGTLTYTPAFILRDAAGNIVKKDAIPSQPPVGVPMSVPTLTRAKK